MNDSLTHNQAYSKNSLKGSPPSWPSALLNRAPVESAALTYIAFAAPCNTRMQTVRGAYYEEDMSFEGMFYVNQTPSID